MKQITELWSKVHQCLYELDVEDNYLTDLLNEFDEIFIIKEAQEYKESSKVELYYTPQEFARTSAILKRAFLEGYVLAQARQRKKEIKSLYNCYHKEIKNESTDSYDSTLYPALSKWFSVRKSTTCSGINS